MPFSTLHYREDPDYWAKWFPADFITESFPGQFRNWFYSMLAMSTVLRREPPFKTIFGYATLFGEDGRPMHKSWGNAIEFDEAAERMGVDVMRWMYAKARPEDNILFGWHAADEARRELLVLWNVYAFFVTYARLAGWTPDAGPPRRSRRRAAAVLDRWILSRAAGLAADVGDAARRLRRASARRARSSTFIDDLSTWYLRLSRKRFSRNDDAADRDAAFATLHAALVALGRIAGADPAVPGRGDVRQPRRRGRCRGARTRVHLTRWPGRRAGAAAATSRSRRRWRPRAAPSSWPGRCAAQAGLRTRQPLARLWLALPGGDLPDREALLDADPRRGQRPGASS